MTRDLAARDLVPAMADEIEALRAENARLQAIIDATRAYAAGEPSNPPATRQAKRRWGDDA